MRDRSLDYGNHRQRHHRTSWQKHRQEPALPEKFGMREALGVCRLSLAEAWAEVVSCVRRFDRVRNSVRYTI